MTYADLFVRALSGSINLAFGVPGGAIEPLYDALHRAQKRGEMRLVTARHEAAAVAMAEGAFRACGRLAISCATTGPGALNMVTALASALEECQPVLAITAQTPQTRFGRGGLQDSSDVGVDTTAVLGKVCKYSSTVTHVAQLLPKLRQALTHAMTAPRGPVHLSVPSDIFKMAGDQESLQAWAAAVSDIEVSTGSAPDLSQPAMLQLWNHFGGARRPVLVLGEESSQDRAAILEFLVEMNWPVVTTAAGHGVIATDHPCYRGVLGFAGHASARVCVDESDAVLVIGSHFRDFCVAASPVVLSSRALHVAPTMKSLTSTVEGTRAILAGIRPALQALRAAAPGLERQAAMDPRPNMEDLPFSAPPVAIEATLQALSLPQRVLYDAGNAWSWSIHYLGASEQRESIRSMGLGQMAWAIPTAIGAAIADPDTRAVCVTGDGSFLMCSHEVTVAVQERVPVVFIVLNDQQLGMVKHGQKMGGAEPAGFALPAINFSQMATAQGASALRVRSAEDLKGLGQCLREANGGPILIELMIDGNFAPPMGERVRQLKEAEPA